MSRSAYKDEKWITSALKISSRKKNKLYQKWIVSGNKSDELAYVKYRSIYKAVVNKSEAMYYRNQFDAKTQSLKQIWANLNQVISAKNNPKANNTIDKLIVTKKLYLLLLILVIHLMSFSVILVLLYLVNCPVPHHILLTI
jgi:hypothetical protein